MLYSNLKKNLREPLNSVITLWSKKGMTASFLGLTAHIKER